MKIVLLTYKNSTRICGALNPEVYGWRQAIEIQPFFIKMTRHKNFMREIQDSNGNKITYFKYVGNIILSVRIVVHHSCARKIINLGKDKSSLKSPRFYLGDEPKGHSHCIYLHPINDNEVIHTYLSLNSCLFFLSI